MPASYPTLISRAILILAALCATIGMTGCTVVGPESIRSGRLSYNEAVQVTSDQELLLNIVRLRYRDTPTILQIASINTQFNLESRLNGGTTIVPSNAENYSISGTQSYYERPTISYRPVVGQAYIQQMLEPINEDKLTLLYNAGWPVDILFGLTVQSINGIQNAPGASGPTPELDPDFRRFQRVIGTFRNLQRAGLLTVGRKGTNSQLRIAKDPGMQEQIGFLQKTLNLDPATQTYNIAQATESGGGKVRSLAVVPRSLMSAMFYLSQGVDVPPKDQEQGRVFTAQYADGKSVDWQKETKGLFRVRTSWLPPDDTYVQVNYRDRWFFIDDSDLSSKTTFALVSQLFAMQSGSVRNAGPVLTLPVGGG
ncbi:MAG: hypothetical protein AAF333_02835 [Planctomycetota bacterium]